MADEYIGVYHADGGIVGEAKYVVGHLLGRVHCSLCDITHSPVRRKREWDRFVAGLGVPFRLYHLNEMPPDVAAVVREVGSPVVLRREGGDLRVVISSAELEQMGGSVAQLAGTVARALGGFRFPDAEPSTAGCATRPPDLPNSGRLSGPVPFRSRRIRVGSVG